MRRISLTIASLVIVLLLLGLPAASAQQPVNPGTAFTYNGRLNGPAGPVNGVVQMRFALYNAATGGTLVTRWIDQSVAVENGLFTTVLDFGPKAFVGEARWLEISVDGTLLTPRQALTPTPLALALPGIYTQQTTGTPNIIGGWRDNSMTPGVIGAVISGGGQPGALNRITDNFGAIGGGENNVVGDNDTFLSGAAYSVVGGGTGNIASGFASLVGGGFGNKAAGNYTTIGGGYKNGVDPDADAPTIAGGKENYVEANFGTVGGGLDNISSFLGTVGGGGANAAYRYATVGGGLYNTAGADYATVGGGNYNRSLAPYATIGGGGSADLSSSEAMSSTSNLVTDAYGTVGGGGDNQAGNATGTDDDASYATVSGGMKNTASHYYATVSGGIQNTASGNKATVGGGYNNTANGNEATVGGGYNNTASGDEATVGGGQYNTANKSTATVSGGSSNTASGSGATVTGGYKNVAGGDYSLAAGQRANALHSGTFVWGDTQLSTISSSASDQFIVRARGGLWLGSSSGTVSIPAGRFIATSTGAYLSSGGTWANSSDRNLKTNIVPVDSRSILESVATMPIARWNYTAEDASAEHIGPMAQDFHAAFGLGQDDTHISTVDADGVALASIQGLYQLVQEKDQRITALEQQVAALKTTAPGTDDVLPGWLLALAAVAMLALISSALTCAVVITRRSRKEVA